MTTITEYLRTLPLDEDPCCDPEFEKLLSGRPDTTAAAGVWAAIAAGRMHVEDTLRWAQHVAREVEKNVTHGSERDAAPAALKAIGFYGRTDPYRTARECLATVASFDAIGDDGNVIPAIRWTAAQWLAFLRGQGFLLNVERKTALNKINLWRQELGVD